MHSIIFYSIKITINLNNIHENHSNRTYKLMNIIKLQLSGALFVSIRCVIAFYSYPLKSSIHRRSSASQLATIEISKQTQKQCTRFECPFLDF